MARAVKIAAVIAALAAIVLTARHFGGVAALSSPLDRISHLGPLAPAAFVLIYVVACVLFVPGSILTIGAGVIFGLVRGSILVSIAATAGATAAFLVGRYLARGWVSRQLEDRPRFRAIDAAVAREGWKIVLLTRLSPVFPFNLLNYAFGLTRVRLGEYVAASWIGMLPSTVMYVYIGALSGDLARSAGRRGERTAAEWALDGVGFLATVAVAIYVTRIATHALHERNSDSAAA
ncbi:MAG TPA: TVP38/TMEM64 family protein [Candidatus Binataceae bacterium]|nr:TVP38/TMEM64 family protein [Candidatus Binataceae bacterium]